MLARLCTPRLHSQLQSGQLTAFCTCFNYTGSQFDKLHASARAVSPMLGTWLPARTARPPARRRTWWQENPPGKGRGCSAWERPSSAGEKGGRMKCGRGAVPPSCAWSAGCTVPVPPPHATQASASRSRALAWKAKGTKKLTVKLFLQNGPAEALQGRGGPSTGVSIR